MKKFLFVLTISIFSPHVLAGGGSGKISLLFVHANSNGDGIILFSTSSNSNKAACSLADGKRGWAFKVDSPLGQAMYSLLLTAITMNREILIIGTGNCENWSDREKPLYIRLKD